MGTLLTAHPTLVDHSWPKQSRCTMRDRASTGGLPWVDDVGVDGGLPAGPTRPRTPGAVRRTRRDAHRSARTGRSSVGR